MICPHCGEPVTLIRACQQVTHVQEVTIVDDEPYVQHGHTIEFPRGRSRINYRCGGCGGELEPRTSAALLKRAAKR